MTKIEMCECGKRSSKRKPHMYSESPRQDLLHAADGAAIRAGFIQNFVAENEVLTEDVLDDLDLQVCELRDQAQEAIRALARWREWQDG